MKYNKIETHHVSILTQLTEIGNSILRNIIVIYGQYQRLSIDDSHWNDSAREVNERQIRYAQDRIGKLIEQLTLYRFPIGRLSELSNNLITLFSEDKIDEIKSIFNEALPGIRILNLTEGVVNKANAQTSQINKGDSLPKSKLLDKLTSSGNKVVSVKLNGTCYSIIGYKVKGASIILTLLSEEGITKGTFKTLEVPEDTSLNNESIEYIAGYHNGSRIVPENSMTINGFEEDGIKKRKPLSTYFMSITPMSPVVLSTINTRNEDSSKRDFTIIGAKKIGDNLYDIEIVRDIKGDKKFVRAKITGEAGSEQIEFQGEYLDRGYFRSKLFTAYNQSRIVNVTKVQLGLAEKSSFWNRAVNMYNKFKNQDIPSVHPAQANVPPKQQVQENHIKVAPQSIQSGLDSNFGNEINVGETILPAISQYQKGVTFVLQTSGGIKTATIRDNLTNDTETNYRFTVFFGNDQSDTAIMLIPKKSFITIGGNSYPEISIAGKDWGNSPISLDRVLINGKLLFDKNTVRTSTAQQPQQPQPTPPTPTSWIKNPIQSAGNIVSRGWKKLFGSNR